MKQRWIEEPPTWPHREDLAYGFLQVFIGLLVLTIAVSFYPPVNGGAAFLIVMVSLLALAICFVGIVNLYDGFRHRHDDPVQ